MASYDLTVSEPVITDRQFQKPLMCGAGPSDVWPSIPESLARPVISFSCDEYYKVMNEIRAGIQYLFQTQSKLVLPISGSGNAGMETVITNLLAPGELLLIPYRGFWDKRAGNMAVRHGIKVETIRSSVPFSTYSLEEIESALEEHRPAGLFVTHGDSSTGTIQNLKGLGELCHKYGCLLLVDAVMSLGAEPFFMDAWGVDGAYAACQKALSGPAGISPVAFSARAEARMKNRYHEPPFYFDMKLLSKQWNCYDEGQISMFSYHHTSSVPLLWALRCCLREVIVETLPKTWARHAAATAHFHKRLQQHGFQLLIKKPEDRLHTITTVELQACDHKKFVDRMREKHNILITVGVGPTAGKVLRVGLMGVNATVSVANRLADAMAETAGMLLECDGENMVK